MSLWFTDHLLCTNCIFHKPVVPYIRSSFPSVTHPHLFIWSINTTTSKNALGKYPSQLTSILLWSAQVFGSWLFYQPRRNFGKYQSDSVFQWLSRWQMQGWWVFFLLTGTWNNILLLILKEFWNVWYFGDVQCFKA